MKLLVQFGNDIKGLPQKKIVQLNFFLCEIIVQKKTGE